MVGREAARIVFTILLARLVGPEAFGIVAQAVVYIGIVGLLLDQGFSSALIQRPRVEPDMPGAVVSVNLAVGSGPHAPDHRRCVGVGLVHGHARADARPDPARADAPDPRSLRDSEGDAPTQHELPDDRSGRRHRRGRRWSARRHRCAARGELLGARGADRHDGRRHAARAPPCGRRYPAEPTIRTPARDHGVLVARVHGRGDLLDLTEHRQPPRREVPGPRGARLLRSGVSAAAPAGSAPEHDRRRCALPGVLATSGGSRTTFVPS